MPNKPINNTAQTPRPQPKSGQPFRVHPLPAHSPSKRHPLPTPRTARPPALCSSNQPDPFFLDMEALSRRVICADQVQNMYSGRAYRYDDERGAWHARLAEDFVGWLGPIAPGSKVLDLACGTGLVTYAAARAVGRGGLVVGVDITQNMLECAKKKMNAASDGESARIEWARGDVSGDLVRDVRAVKRVIEGPAGGFDIITCCSAFVLLADADHCLDRWLTLLRPGGRLIIDTPTEDKTVQRLWHDDMKRAVGMKCMFDVLWIKSSTSLAKKMQRAGFEVEKSFRVNSYVPEFYNENNEMWKIFNRNMHLDLSVASEGKEQAARKIWPRLWESALQEDGRLWNGQALYVTVGRKKAG